MSTAPPSELLDRALSLCRLQWAVRAAAALLAVALPAAAGVGALLVLAGVAAPLPVQIAALAAGAAGLLAAGAWAARHLLGGTSPTRVAALVEARFPELSDRFVTAVEIAWSARRREGSRPWTTVGGCSPALARAVMDDARDAVRELDLRRAIDTRPVRRLGPAAAAAAVLLLGAALAFPRSWANLLSPPPREAPALTPARRQASPQPAPTGPSLVDVALRLEYPAYTGIAPETRRSDLEVVSALVGTRATVLGKALGDGPRAEIALNGSWQTVTVGERGGIAAPFVLLRDTTWTVRATDAAGRTMATPSYRLKALADRPPRVAIAEPGRNLDLRVAGTVRLAYEAGDDFGLTAVALEYRAPGDSKWRSVALPSEGGRATSGAFDWDLSPLRLMSGQSVSYRVTARDNDTVSGPKSGASPVYLVTIGEPAASGAGRAVPEPPAKEAEGLEQLQREAEELGRQLDEAIARIEKGETTREEQARQSAELAEARRRIGEQADKVSRALTESERKLAAEGTVPPEVRAKLAELHDLLQKTMNEDLKRALDQIQEALKSANPNDLQRSLQEARQSQQEFAARLDQAIQLLKRAHLEQDVARAAEEAGKLAADQKQLNDRRGELPQPGRLRAQAAEQRELKRRESALESGLQQLAQEAQPVDPQTAEQLARAADALQKSGAQQAMQQAAERLEAADPSGAAPPQEAAASALDQAASSLRRLQAGMSSAGGQKLSRAAQELTRDTLFLSRQQEQLLQSTEALQPLSAQSASRGKPQREATRRRQEGLARSTRELGGRLRALAQQTPLLDPSLAGQAEQAAGVMDQAAREAAAGAGLQAAQTQREAMGELNGLAEELLRLGEQLQQAGQGAAIQQLLQQLQGLAQQQRGLNQQTQQRSGQGSTPRRQGSSGNLADQQAAIREALERLLQRAGKGSGLPDKLGGTGQEMKDVEQRLREERLGRETQQRQADILRHMLDAQRSVYRKNEERRERVSERPKPFRLPPSPPELKPRSAPQTGPRMTPGEGADLPLDFEDLVREYFRALAERP